MGLIVLIPDHCLSFYFLQGACHLKGVMQICHLHLTHNLISRCVGIDSLNCKDFSLTSGPSCLKYSYLTKDFSQGLFTL